MSLLKPLIIFAYWDIYWIINKTRISFTLTSLKKTDPKPSEMILKLLKVKMDIDI